MTTGSTAPGKGKSSRPQRKRFLGRTGAASPAASATKKERGDNPTPTGMPLRAVEPANPQQQENEDTPACLTIN